MFLDDNVIQTPDMPYGDTLWEKPDAAQPYCHQRIQIDKIS